jgi:hypothetical protein
MTTPPLQTWILDRIRQSPHAPMLLDTPPAIQGAGDRVLAAVGPDAHRVVYLATRHGGATVRVGFATDDRWANEEVEDGVESNGGTMTEFLEDEMEADDELKWAVQHFHERGWFHFASDITRDAAAFDTVEGREELWLYFDGYCRGILPHVMK